jgi:hypothetical protein
MQVIYLSPYSLGHGFDGCIPIFGDFTGGLGNG